MTEESVAALLREAGALIDGHFRLASGRHSPIYVEKFRLLERPPATERLCKLIAERFRDEGPQLVAGPTTGGIIVSYEVARQLGLRGIFAESAEGGGREFRRDFQIAPGERTLIVDDVLTTGGSVRDVIEAVRRSGGEPIGIAVLVDRSGGRTDFGLPFFACLELNLPTYEEGACPLCEAQTPLVVT
jgi:orotate phosphoribosyltransferase